jgi:RES domain-containing protein
MEIARAAKGLYWRVMAPKWAFDPLSGAGAARNGGRFNPPSVPTLYLSEKIETALAEYSQDLPDRPGTFCAYTVDVPGIVDLSDREIQEALGVTHAMLTCPWKKIALIDKITPPSWTLGRRLLDAGYNGMISHSILRPRTHNLILWRWNDGSDDQVRYHDPNDELPSRPRQ